MTPATPNRKLKVVLARVKLWQEGTVVWMQVLAQNIGSTGQEFQSTSGMSVQAISNPEISKNLIFLRGTDHNLDSRPAYRDCGSFENAAEYIDKCRRTLRTPLYI